ncbi:energy-coupling factor transporter ATP-binding protein EcfA2 [Flavobacterium sp. 7E]|uniref:ATP-binding protein n=1 Tax=Flavobacterium sp. 7E TaxID=2735898 RepID=UPI00156FC9EA|nr:AAA family ATPase [Flavobacterium sp. 7E]NRS87665.1 energy-coupling factor transporter ATP-binding protein EcfA2 [Flavobacterium sp. 7E]
MAQQKIDKIAIQNFKFFAKEEVIQISGRNVLLYGENGSGKSSIYWAIYTLLEAANKEDVNEISKYFDINCDERLLNINLEQNTALTPKSFIKIEFVGGDEPYEVSFSNTSINKNILAKESNLSSDFINYRHLLSLYNFAHSDEINLFDFFRYAILPYDKFSPINIYNKGKSIDSQSAIEIVNYILTGPPKLEEEEGLPIYPTKSSNKIYHENFEKSVMQSVSQLEDLITYLNTEGNPILQIDLEYDITFKLTLEYSKVFKISKNSYEAPEFKIILTLPDYEGKKEQVKKPHSFLNEAKLTAVALAIRLAVLKRTLSKDSSESLKLLVLDDLMISLDMSNRERILNLILNKYVKQYQIFILTHDRSLFFDTLQHIKQHYIELALKEGITNENDIETYTTDHWNILELYQAINSSGYAFPYITDHKTHIQKAYYYFKENIDFKACANNLRSALESHFRDDFFPYTYLKDADGNPLKAKDLTLGVLLKKGKMFYEQIGFNKRPLILLERFILRSLNPQSHYNPHSNFYRKELEDVFQIYSELKSVVNVPLILTDTNLVFDVCTTTSEKYTYTIKLLDHIRIYRDFDVTNFDIQDNDKRGYGLISIDDNKGKIFKPKGDINNLSLLELYNYTTDKVLNDQKKQPIIETNSRDIFKTEDGKSIQNIIDGFVLKYSK